MQEKDLFECAVLRVVPGVEREKFFNVGIVLYCAKQKSLKAIYKIDEKRLEFLCGDCNIPAVNENLNAFEQISSGSNNSGSIGKLPLLNVSVGLRLHAVLWYKLPKYIQALRRCGEMLEKLFGQLME